MANNDFFKQTQDAAQRMLEMNAKAVRKNAMPPVPPFVKIPSQDHGQTVNDPPPSPKVPEKKEGINGIFNLPLLDRLKAEPDISLIIGLLLILMSEKSDKRLLFALLYIML